MEDQERDPAAAADADAKALAARSAKAVGVPLRTTSTVERALDLARSGECQSLDELRSRLRSEGFGSIEAHTAGASIKAQLKKLMADAQSQKE